MSVFVQTAAAGHADAAVSHSAADCVRGWCADVDLGPDPRSLWLHLMR